MRTTSLTVNGRVVTAAAPPEWTLLAWLRDRAHAYEVKNGCNEGVCGACTVLLDGRSVASCCLLAAQAEGREVTTSTALAAEDGALSTLQEQFWAAGAVQCGFCTGGMLLAAYELIAEGGQPSREEIRDRLHGNLCRCTGYTAIIDAVEQTLREERAGGDD